jgi:hypothetical protein
MDNLSVPALLAVHPNVGWLDLPIPPHSKLALFLDDEELETIAALTKLNILPVCMAGHLWAWHIRDNASVLIEELLDNPMDYINHIDHQENEILVSFGTEILGYVDVVIGTVLLIYNPSAEDDVQKALGGQLDSERQRATFATFINKVRGDDLIARAKLLSDRYLIG